MRDSKKIIVLNKDQSVKTVKYTDIDKIEKSQYVLIPINGYGTHIVIKPSDFVTFHHAVIKFRISVYDIYNDGESRMFRNPYNVSFKTYDETVKEIDNVIDFYNLMHSISRIDYGNLVYDEYYQAQWYNNTFVYLAYLDVTLYDSNNNVTYHKQNITKPDSEGVWHNSAVMEKFKKVYKTSIRKIYENSDKNILEIYMDKWKLKSSSDRGLLGLMLGNTNSVTFITPQLYDLFHYIESASYEIIIYTASKKSIDKISSIISQNKYTTNINEYSMFNITTDYKNVELHQDALAMSTPTQLIEFITYIPQIHLSIEMIYNSPIIEEIEFDTVINLKISVANKKRKSSFIMTGNQRNIQTLDDFVLKLCEELH